MSTRWEVNSQAPGGGIRRRQAHPKTVLTSRAMLTGHEQRTLDKMSCLEHFATVAKGTAQVLPKVDEEHDIQSVIFLWCEMWGDSHAVAEVSRLPHGCFPNPTVIFQEAGDSVAISVALTRKSYVERGATVVYDVESAGLFDTDDRRYEPFLDSLAFERLPQDGLLSYLGAIASCARLSQAIVPLGFYPACTSQDRDRLLLLVAEYRRQQAEVDALATERRSKDVSPNESARIWMGMRAAEQKLDATVEEIRGICHA